ncbi:hypothetical protein ACNKHT_06050 [Shigella flexneri]
MFLAGGVVRYTSDDCLNPKCSAKTFPDYFEQLARISQHLNEQRAMNSQIFLYQNVGTLSAFFFGPCESF